MPSGEMSEATEVRSYLRRRHHGVLSTISQKLGGYPFGSVVPFVLDHGARPVILISRLAEHTRNVEADPRVSLLASDGGGNAQAGARVTLVGEAARLEDQQAPRARYLRYFPDAERLLALGDFAFYAIAPKTVRYIGGFGDIRWISSDAYAPPANDFAAQEDALIARMNVEHAHDLRDLCRHYHGRAASQARLVGIDCDGFDVRADGELVRIDFERPASDAAEAREALLAMANRVRAA